MATMYHFPLKRWVVSYTVGDSYVSGAMDSLVVYATDIIEALECAEGMLYDTEDAFTIHGCLEQITPTFGASPVSPSIVALDEVAEGDWAALTRVLNFGREPSS